MSNMIGHHEREPAPASEAMDPTDLESTTRAKRSPRSLWATIRAGTGAALGVLPHVMHHVGLIAGAALLTGAIGNSILYVVGLLLSIPLLKRLRSKFQTSWAPAIGIGVFTALFSLSAFVIGPAISGSGEQAPATNPTPAVSTTDGHAAHH